MGKGRAGEEREAGKERKSEERRTRKDGRLREKCSGRWARGDWRQERCARVVKDTWVRRGGRWVRGKMDEVGEVERKCGREKRGCR